MKIFWLTFHLIIYFFKEQQDQSNKHYFFHLTAIEMVWFYDMELVLVSIHYQLQYIFLKKDEQAFQYLIRFQSNSTLHVKVKINNQMQVKTWGKSYQYI
jgi:hypothetical protein